MIDTIAYSIAWKTSAGHAALKIDWVDQWSSIWWSSLPIICTDLKRHNADQCSQSIIRNARLGCSERTDAMDESWKPTSTDTPSPRLRRQYPVRQSAQQGTELERPQGDAKSTVVAKQKSVLGRTYGMCSARIFLEILCLGFVSRRCLAVPGYWNQKFHDILRRRLIIN